jgi:hypothetical protein
MVWSIASALVSSIARSISAAPPSQHIGDFIQRETRRPTQRDEREALHHIGIERAAQAGGSDSISPFSS